MAVEGGPNIIDDGLVLALDGSNVRSFRGEPTTNVVTNTNLDTGWSKGYNTSIQWNDYPPPDGVNSQVVSFVDSNADGFGYWYSYGDYAPQDPSTTYTISIYARTIGSNWSLEAYTADNSETGRQWTNTLTVPGDGKWYRLVFNSFTTPANTQSDSLSFQFSSIPANQRCWLCAPQMEAKSYATPFVDGTRGTTNATSGGWVDLSGNGRHGELVNGPTYNSDNGGSIVFDGSNDYIDVAYSTGLNTPNGATYSLWMYVSSTGEFLNRGTSDAGTTPDNPRIYTNATNRDIYFDWSTTGTDRYVNTSANSYSATNTWFNLVCTVTAGGRIDVYVNAVLCSYTTRVNADTMPNPLPNTSNSIQIGGATWIPRYFGGRIATVALYNRALSATEILQNFNVQRKRFGV